VSVSATQSRKARFNLSGYIDRMPESTFSQFLLLPVYLFLVVGLGFPVVYSIYLSFFDMQLTRLDDLKFVGLGNYLDLFSDTLFQRSVPATLIFMVGTTALSVLISIGLALLLNQPLRGKTIYRVILLVPWAVPPVVNGWMWLWIFNYNFGAVNHLLTHLGILSQHLNWLGQTSTAMASLIVAETWKAIPFLTFLLLAKVLDIPKNQYRAAEIDGANAWQRFRFVTLPGIKSTLLVVIILQSMWSLKVFDLVFVMTKGQPNDTTAVLNYMVYQLAFEFTNVGYGSAAAWVLTGIIIVVSAIYFSFLRDR
jgi:multiple sugar transport system permease protein